MMRRTVVLGAGGFLGSHLVRELLAGGHVVLAVVRQGSGGYRLAGMACEVVQGRLETIETLRPRLAGFRPQTVVQMAWQGVANTHHGHPVQADNIAATVRIAALTADIGARAFVAAGSQAEYGPQDRVLTEADDTRPTTLYGMAKLAAGQMAERLCADRGVRFAWLRVFSTYGAMDNGGWLIPSTIRRLRRGDRVPLTRCEQRWSFLHARDAATAFRTVIEREDAHGVFNTGHPGAPVLADTLNRLRDLVGPCGELGFGDLPYRPDQVMRLQPDIGRLAALGWAPRVDLETGLRDTLEWHVRSGEP